MGIPREMTDIHGNLV
ncbi:hypothetical protein [Streptococcus sp. HJ1]